MKLLKFQASWCGPCKMLSKTIETVKSDIDIPIEEVDIDDNPTLATKYGVRGVPTLVLVNDETEIARKVGMMNPAQFKQFLEENK